jgi:hypothetical protein
MKSKIIHIKLLFYWSQNFLSFVIRQTRFFFTGSRLRLGLLFCSNPNRNRAILIVKKLDYDYDYSEKNGNRLPNRFFHNRGRLHISELY